MLALHGTSVTLPESLNASAGKTYFNNWETATSTIEALEFTADV